MKRVFLILVFGLASHLISYATAPIELLTGLSQLIVKAEVLDVGKHDMRVKVDKVLKGCSGVVIKVRYGKKLCKSCEDVCVGRGDHVYLFLKKTGIHYRTIDESSGIIIEQCGELSRYFDCGCQQPCLAEFENSIRQFAWMYKARVCDCQYIFEQKISDCALENRNYHSDFADYLTYQVKHYPVLK